MLRKIRQGRETKDNIIAGELYSTGVNVPPMMEMDFEASKAVCRDKKHSAAETLAECDSTGSMSIESSSSEPVVIVRTSSKSMPSRSKKVKPMVDLDQAEALVKVRTVKEDEDRFALETSMSEEICENILKPTFFSNESAVLSSTAADMLSSCGKALSLGLHPTLLEEGVTDVFVMKHPKSGYVAVFKPEEQIQGRVTSASFCDPIGSPSNAESHFASRGLTYKQGAIREVMAYLLDLDGFVGVPETIMVKVSGKAFENDNKFSFPYNQPPRCYSAPMTRSSSLIVPNEEREEHFPRKWVTGSLQKYVAHDLSAEDLGPSLLDPEFVQRIGLFDVRVLNSDRHEGNILLKFEDPSNFKSRSVLYPIDHAFILPEITEFNAEGNFCWMNWPQSKLPFSEASKEYIRGLNAESDGKLLKRCLGSKLYSSTLLSLKIGTMILKIAVLEYGRSLYDIGCFLTRILDNQGNDNLTAFTDIIQQSVSKTKTDHEMLEMFASLTRDYFM